MLPAGVARSGFLILGLLCVGLALVYVLSGDDPRNVGL